MANLENFRLVVFRAVAETLSFRKAAEELYLTQPAISLQIKSLEEDLGVQLFDRTGGHVTLTPAGRILLQQAKQSGELLRAAEREIAALDGIQAGNLTLGASTTIAQYVLPGLLSRFCRQHPLIHVNPISGNTEHIVEAVENQKIALGLIEGPAQSQYVKTEPFLQDELVPIAAITHTSVRDSAIPCAELAAMPLLMRERGSGTRHVVEMALEKAGVKRNSLKVVMELDSTEAIKSAVEAGLGVGFVPRCALAQDLRLDRSFKIVEVKGVRVRREFLIARLSGPLSPGPAAEFRKFLLACAGPRAKAPAPRHRAPA